jgi:hypothetical protein
MKRNKIISFLLVIIILQTLISGCGGNGVSEPEPISDIVFSSKRDDFASLVITENTEIIAASWENGIARYSSDGNKLEEYPGTENIFCLAYYNGLLYGYDTSSRNIVEYDPQRKTLRVVYAGLHAEEIRSLAVSGEYIVLITVPTFDGLDFANENGYIYFGEKFLKIHISSGKLTELDGIKNPISLYKSNDGTIYVYARPVDRYILYSFDIGRGRASQIAVMDDVGYLFTFAYERDTFVFFLGDIRAKKMPNGLEYIVSELFPVVSGNGFSYFQGNLIFLGQHVQEMACTEGHGPDCLGHGPSPPPTTSIQTMRLNDDFAVLAKTGLVSETAQPRGNVVIAATNSNMLFDTGFLRNSSGITGIYTEISVFIEEQQRFITSILAGNDDVDIYILFLHNDISRALRNQGRYVPLNDSEPIRAYLDQCYDWVGEAARAENGDIWMLPLFFNTPALWYLPDNFDQYNLTPADVAGFDQYFQTVDRLNREAQGGHVTLANWLGSVDYSWFRQYERTYNDYQNGVISFETDLFRNYFERMWSGWNRNEEMHPVLQNHRNSRAENNIIFKLDYASIHFQFTRGNVEGWRVLPMPRLSDNVVHNEIVCVYAVVNPFSQNKELAVAYLEAAAADMLSAITEPVFVQREISAYEGHIDMSVPMYQDLHQLFRDGAAVMNVFPEAIFDILDAYQDGLSTLDEAVREIQRRVDIWLNE